MANTWQVQATMECSRADFEASAALSFRRVEQSHGVSLKPFQYSVRTMPTKDGVQDVHFAVAEEV